ncbi:TcaA 3rd/4th domain-containing protein [Alkalicoccobacillus plakortidis]|uniref:Uncharacterized protein n=1 Tax=Alkalicoccobacillus plakortidis TaxID=444060 RepID=A0ABT0XMK0_9BACI|nr:hypothetical protein [Alkalicoccobacillus plakortidis]MCM2677136.1 hypothetical protein [Alkalicoccobacillus plakortidis]
MTAETSKKRPGLLIGGIIAVVVFVLLAGGGVFFVTQIGGSSNGEELLTTFEEALNNGDAEALSSVLTSAYEDWQYQTEDAEALFLFFEDEPTEKDALLNRLNEEMEMYEEDGEDAAQVIHPAYQEDNFGNITLTYEDGGMFSGAEYELVVTPAYISMHVENENLQFFLNDEEVKPTSYDGTMAEFGPFGPGSYTMRTELQLDYATATTEDVTLNIYHTEDEVSRIEVIVPEVNMLKARSNYDDSIVYLNDEETDLVVNQETEDVTELPADESMSVSLEKEFPWGKVKSEDMTYDGSILRFDEFVGVPEEERTKVVELLDEAMEQRSEVIMNGDESVLTHGNDEFKESVLSSHESRNERSEYKSEHVQTSFLVDDLSIPVFNEEENRYELAVDIIYVMNELNHGSFNLGREGSDGQFNRNHFRGVVYYDEDWVLETITPEIYHYNSSDETIDTGPGIEEYEANMDSDDDNNDDEEQNENDDE